MNQNNKECGETTHISRQEFSPLLTAICSFCGELKPLFDFSTESRNKNGKAAHCKACAVIKARKYAIEHPESTKIRKAKWHQDNRERLLRERKEYYLENAEKLRCDAKQYYYDNFEKISAYNKTPERKAASRKWFADNDEKVKQSRKLSRPQKTKYQREYRNTPEGRAFMLAGFARRRHNLAKSETTVTAEEWLDILKWQENRCAICDKVFSKSLKATQDHIIPLSKGGLHKAENIQALCQECNSRKGNKIIQKHL
jgi:5-methylcytosine-specific restriction endonuclease McrA